jgi:hypothetical protein
MAGLKNMVFVFGKIECGFFIWNERIAQGKN